MSNIKMHHMGPITLRNLPPEVVHAIQKEAKQKKLSLNRAVIQLLEKSIGVASKQETPRYHDLDKLAGSWSLEEARNFNKALVVQRTIDTF